MVRLVVKNAGQPDFPLELSDSGTVGDLKDELQRSYPSHPTPAQQKLIFAGRLLNDGSQIISHLITASKVHCLSLLGGLMVKLTFSCAV